MVRMDCYWGLYLTGYAVPLATFYNSHKIISTLQPFDPSKANEDLDGIALRGCARPRGLHSLSSRRSFSDTTRASFIGQGEGGLGGNAR